MRVAIAALLASCMYLPRPSHSEGENPGCLLEPSERFGPDGTAPVRAETVASGLEVPWAFAFLPGGDVLVSERPGRVRLLHSGKVVEKPVLTVRIAEVEEGGLLGIALHPADPSLLYLYATVAGDHEPENQVQRWQLSPDHSSATLDRVILGDIRAAPYHDGGRIRFGPDGMLYVSTGDARDADLAQDPHSPNGKILRLLPDGAIPKDNPLPGNPLWLLGVRNSQGFDWLADGTLVVSDHGPSGEMLRKGHDEVTFAHGGDNLGWPTIYGCQSKAGMLSPAISWEKAVPPGGAIVYAGSAIPQWKGSILLATLQSEHLHRIEPGPQRRAINHEVYFRGAYGRLREIALTPSGELWFSTSNCDGRGKCGPQKDRILRVVE